MGRNIIFDSEGNPIIDVKHTEQSLNRKFKKGDKVKIKELCEKEPYCRCPRYFRANEKCNHHRWCNQVGIVEDTEEAGSNWQGIPKYGLRSVVCENCGCPVDETSGDFRYVGHINPEVHAIKCPCIKSMADWFGDFLEDEIDGI